MPTAERHVEIAKRMIDYMVLELYRKHGVHNSRLEAKSRDEKALKNVLSMCDLLSCYGYSTYDSFNDHV